MSQKIRHDQLTTILIAPHVSEKSTLLSQNSGQIAFRVRPDSNKRQIKKAVEQMFNVKVSSVKTISVKGKKKRIYYFFEYFNHTSESFIEKYVKRNETK